MLTSTFVLSHLLDSSFLSTAWASSSASFPRQSSADSAKAAGKTQFGLRMSCLDLDLVISASACSWAKMAEIGAARKVKLVVGPLLACSSEVEQTYRWVIMVLLKGKDQKEWLEEDHLRKDLFLLTLAFEVVDLAF